MTASKAGNAGTVKKHPKFAPLTLDFLLSEPELARIDRIFRIEKIIL